MTAEIGIKKDIDLAAKILKEAGASEVFVFGSTSRGKERPDSDIDLAVRGLPPERFFRTMTKIGIAISREFDLVDLDESIEFAEFLEKKGELSRVA
jgi:predicted nucleotidyltransferase